ncbi:MAG: hypothetical protein HOV94_34310 [Saccharothrix sp.]|nr:hypothetical protein [Saccharothrix sp.]
MRTVLTTLIRIALVPVLAAGIAFGLGAPAQAAEQVMPTAGTAESRLGRIEWPVTEGLVLYAYLDHPGKTAHYFLNLNNVEVWKGTKVGSGELTGSFPDGTIRTWISWPQKRLSIVIVYQDVRYERGWAW